MFPLYPGELRGPADKNVCEAQREVGRRPSNLASCKNPAGYLARGKWAQAETTERTRVRSATEENAIDDCLKSQIT